MSTLRVLASAKRQSFFGHIRATNVLPIYHLIRVAKAKDQYSPLMRAAALRNLVGNAPLEVTRGACYSARRRSVRAFYGI
jgi:hypothetical protein